MKICKAAAGMVFLVFFACTISSCGNSQEGKGSLDDIPLYPNATHDQTLEGSGPAKIVGGKVARYYTNDAFEDVVNFYTGTLSGYSPQIISHKSELGRQTAITMNKEEGIISVVVQELTEENKVSISLMAVGG